MTPFARRRLRADATGIDPASGVLSRALFVDRLQRQLDHVGDELGAVSVVAVHVHAREGVHVDHQLLRRTAAGMADLVGCDGAVAHLGDGRFVAALPQRLGGSRAEHLARALELHLDLPWPDARAGERALVGAAVAVADGPGRGAEDLLCEAVLALHEEPAPLSG